MNKLNFFYLCLILLISILSNAQTQQDSIQQTDYSGIVEKNLSVLTGVNFGSRTQFAEAGLAIYS